MKGFLISDCANVFGILCLWDEIKSDKYSVAAVSQIKRLGSVASKLKCCNDPNRYQNKIVCHMQVNLITYR